MSDSIETFHSDLNRFADKLHIKVGTVMKKVSLDLYTKITERTPVDTGRARSNWMLTVGEPSKEITGSELSAAQKADRAATRDKAGESAPVFGEPPAPNISEIDGTEPVYIVNNVSYIRFLEEGSSQQAPAGMVKVSVQEVAARIDNALKE